MYNRTTEKMGGINAALRSKAPSILAGTTILVGRHMPMPLNVKEALEGLTHDFLKMILNRAGTIQLIKDYFARFTASLKFSAETLEHDKAIITEFFSRVQDILGSKFEARNDGKAYAKKITKTSIKLAGATLSAEHPELNGYLTYSNIFAPNVVPDVPSNFSSGVYLVGDVITVEHIYLDFN